MATKVSDSVSFRSERAEYLVPIHKLVRGNPSFHLGSNIRSFRPISGQMVISAGTLLSFIFLFVLFDIICFELLCDIKNLYYLMLFV